MAANTDYTNADLTILQMVENRLYFIDFDTDPALKQRASDFIYEIMVDMEDCLRVSLIDWNNTQESSDSVTPPWPEPLPAPDKVGHEEFYTMTMRIMIANLVVVNALMWAAAYNSNAAGASSANGVFMSKAKADVVEVEWKQLTSAAAIGMSTQSLIDYYSGQAKKAASTYGCVLCICDPCAQIAGDQALPFIIVQDCGCAPTSIC